MCVCVCAWKLLIYERDLGFNVIIRSKKRRNLYVKIRLQLETKSTEFAFLYMATTTSPTDDTKEDVSFTIITSHTERE